MISVVIPCYNEEKYIGRCLEAFTKQSTTREFEIIVVDNASTDRTAQVVQQFTSKLPLRLITEPRKGRGAARHAGCVAAQGDIILTTDADAIVPPGWIETMAAAFTSPEIIGVTGTCYITDQSWLANMVFNVVQPTITVLQRLVFGSFWVLGSNGGFRKVVYEQAGGYNPELNSQEDTQFSFLLRKHGTIKYIRQSRVETSGRRFKRGIILGLLEYVRSFIERFVIRKKNVHLRDAR
jgi:glycosyltransferase involved in cell wall biosynthesis